MKLDNNLIAGIFFLMVCIVAFILQTFVANYLQTTLNYTKPYFFLWTTHSLQSIILPLDLLVRKVFMNQKLRENIRVLRSDFVANFSSNYKSSFKVSFCLVFIATFLLNTSFYLWYIGAGLTDVTSLTVIYNTNCFFAYLFSIIVKVDRFYWKKIMGLFIAISGVLIIVLVNKKDASKSKLLGNIIVFVSSVFAGLYEVVYSLFFVKNNTKTSSMFTTFISSYIGLITLSMFWILLPVFHFTKFEIFELPSNQTTILFLVLNMLLGVVFNFCFFAVITLTSPAFASVGIILVVPITPLVQRLVEENSEIMWNIWLGAFVVFSAFTMMVYSNNHQTEPKVLDDGDIIPTHIYTDPITK